MTTADEAAIVTAVCSDIARAVAPALRRVRFILVAPAALRFFGP